MKRGTFKSLTYEEKIAALEKSSVRQRAKLALKTRDRPRIKRKTGLKPYSAPKANRLAAWSKKVKDRDGHKCQWPKGCQTGDNRLDAHHIAERSLRPDLKYDVSNGITLCRTHHNWIPLHRQEAIAMKLLSCDTYEKAMKEKR